MVIRFQIVLTMHTTSKNVLEIWIGLAKVYVEKERSEFGLARNAYVNVLGLAVNKTDFRKKVKRELSFLGFKLLRLEEPEPFSSRIRNFKVDKSLHVLADEIVKNDLKIKFSTFHAYE